MPIGAPLWLRHAGHGKETVPRVFVRSVSQLSMCAVLRTKAGTMSRMNACAMMWIRQNSARRSLRTSKQKQTVRQSSTLRRMGYDTLSIQIYTRYRGDHAATKHKNDNYRLWGSFSNIARGLWHDSRSRALCYIYSSTSKCGLNFS